VTNRVLVLTTGLANAGITAPAMLFGLCRAAREEGITTTTTGIGPRFDERLLAGMADAGDGSTYYIERADQASGVFEEKLEGLLTLCAQNVAVEVLPDTVVQLVAVHHDWPSVVVEGGRRFELGDLYAREPKSLLVDLFVPGVEALGERTLATVTVHAHALTAAGGVERHEATFPVSGSLSRDGREEPEVRREMLLLEAARAGGGAAAAARRRLGRGGSGAGAGGADARGRAAAGGGVARRAGRGPGGDGPAGGGRGAGRGGREVPGAACLQRATREAGVRGEAAPEARMLRRTCGGRRP
jgi:Ca-activated chloride channel family protein